MVLIHNIVLVNFIGEMGISAYSIINYITTNTYMVLYGLTLGVQPLISYNYGRKDGDKMLGFFNITCISSLTVSAAFIVISFLFGKNLIGIFTQDQAILNMAYTALKIASVSYLVVGINLNTLVYFQAIERPKYSNLSCLFRSVIYLPISLLVLYKIFGTNGIWAGTIASESLTFITISIISNIKTSTKEAINNSDLKAVS